MIEVNEILQTMQMIGQGFEHLTEERKAAK